MSDYKQITLENWTQPDPANTCFVRLRSDGKFSSIKAEEYFSDIMNHTLSEQVPEKIQKLYEVTRATMTYGYYYYPIFTVAVEQLFRIVESSVSYVCKTLGSPASIKTFNHKIEWLIELGILEGCKKARWDSLRRLRNARAHPESQMILPPGPVLSLFDEMTTDINSLFNKMNEGINRDN